MKNNVHSGLHIRPTHPGETSCLEFVKPDGEKVFADIFGGAPFHNGMPVEVHFLTKPEEFEVLVKTAGKKGLGVLVTGAIELPEPPVTPHQSRFRRH